MARFLLSLCSWAVALNLAVCHEAPLHTAPCDSSYLSKTLRPSLSTRAAIISPSDPEYEQLAIRWQAKSRPTYCAVVEVATTEDIQHTVAYANEHSLPFLAVTGGHGSVMSLGKFNGIAIHMRNFNKAEINADGQTAELGGGMTNLEVIASLLKAKKYTTTGVCECIGFMSPVLGGGHGLLQGRLGLPADQLVAAHIVLANGSAVTAAADHNSGLLWALRGAGHNFGIVTKVTYKIHDIDEEQWLVQSFVFTEDRLETLFSLLNGLNDNGRQSLPFVFTTFTRHLASNSDSAVILVQLFWQGSAKGFEPFVDSFAKLEPQSQSNITTTYDGLPAACRTGMHDPLCTLHGQRILFAPIGLKMHNVTAVRATYELYNKMTREIPGLNGSSILFEAYSNLAVMKVPEPNTAVGDRQANILASPLIEYTDSNLDRVASRFSKDVKHILQEGSGSTRPLPAYVNYANGDESLDEMYGSSHVARLRRLKREYDPHGRFNYYAPIN